MRRFFFGDKKSSMLQVVNPHLLKDLVELGLWSDDLKNRIISNKGSIQVESVFIPRRLISLFSADDERNTGQHKGAVQDRVGDIAEGDHQSGG